MQIILAGCIIATATIWSAHKMSQALDRLTEEVRQTKGVAASALAALTAVPGLIRDAVAEALAASGTDSNAFEAKLNSLADDLDASIAPLAAAIQANPAPTDPGHDTQAGDDTGSDTVIGGQGDDTLTGADGNDSVTTPTAGDDTVD